MKQKQQKRRPAFDRSIGVETARKLFHQRGYDGVSVMDLVQAININPPSLYAAYGSKINLFELALENYAMDKLAVGERLLLRERSPHQVLSDLLVSTAQQYCEDPDCPGCMIAVALQAADQDARAVAKKIADRNEEYLRRYLNNYFKNKDIEEIISFFMINLRGLSVQARLGLPRSKLVSSAKLAAQAIRDAFPVL